MRAIVYDRYGAPENLELRLMPAPVPNANEVLVRVRAASLNPKDSLIRKGKFKAVLWVHSAFAQTSRRARGDGRPAGALPLPSSLSASSPGFPKLLGYDLAGVVEAVGAKVTHFKVGDDVFGMKNGFSGSTLAEFAVAAEAELAKKPPSLSFEEAAALPLTSLTALQALRDLGKVSAGSRVLIHGSSGGVGVVAVQIAKALGATVTTTSSEKNLDFVRSLGADETLDYTKSIGLERGREWTCVFDVFGNQRFSKAASSLAKHGVYVTTVPSPRNVFDDVRTRWLPFKKARLVVVKSNRADLEVLSKLVSAGSLRAVIDRVVPLAQTAEGQAHIETKRARGKVVVTID